MMMVMKKTKWWNEMKMDPRQMTSNQMNLMNSREIKMCGGRRYMQNQTINIWWNRTKIYSTQSDSAVSFSQWDCANHADHWVLRHNYQCTHALSRFPFRLQCRIEFQEKISSTTTKLCPSEFAVRNLSCDMMKRDAKMTEKTTGKNDVVDGDKEGFYRMKNWKRKNQ